MKIILKLNEKTEKSKICLENFSKSLHIGKTCIVGKNITAGKFNKFFVDVDSNLAAKIPHSDKNFESYLPNVCTFFAAKSLTE